MRFDDSFETVLAAEMSTSLGAQSAWRQLVDLVARGRVPALAKADVLDKLRSLRSRVPHHVRAASARAVATARAPLALVVLFGEDALTVAAPVLRSAQLEVSAWVSLLPGLSPAGRAILRHRRDLPPEVVRALQAYGSVDFVLHGEIGAPAELPVQEHVPAIIRSPDDSPFQSFASVAQGLPVVAQALRQAEAADAGQKLENVSPGLAANIAPRGPFEIADIVARIEAFHRQREEGAVAHAPKPALSPAPVQQEDAADEGGNDETEGCFRFETDAGGLIRWVSGMVREPVIGLSLDFGALSAAGPAGTMLESRVDGVAGGAFRRRASFADARMVIAGKSRAAGQWRISGVPVFDPASGRFTGYRGTARRPRADEQAEPLAAQPLAIADSLRQLVHELRTPTTAIAGFAEMIDGEMLGPVPEVYRRYAGTIREQTRGLLGAIDDLDMAARLDVGALDLRLTSVPLAPLLLRVAADLAPLAALRGAELALEPGLPPLSARGDDRAIDRLISRLMAVLVSAAARGERIGVTLAAEGEEAVVLTVDRPAALKLFSSDALFSIDAEKEHPVSGAPLLGTGFALRLARNLASELDGKLIIGAQCLTLRLPAAFTLPMDRVSTN